MHSDLTSATPHGSAHAPDTAKIPWDTAYEWRAILLLSLGYGLVGFDRYLILPMFPVIMADLKLSYTDLGTITGILAITWGLSAFIVGRLSDRIGRKTVLVAAMTAFSLLVGVSGLAAGAMSLLLIRAMMGVTEGAYTTPSMVATMEVTKPGRHGLTLGLYQMASPLLGFALAPILVTQLLHIVDWRYIFLIATPPGLIISFLLWRTIRAPARQAAHEPGHHAAGSGQLRDLLQYRNVALAALCMLTWLNAVIVLTAFLPSYFVNELKLPTPTMGFVMSAVGFGAIFGAGGIPALSDRLGRKPCLIFAAIGAAAALVTLSRTSADPQMLFVCLLVASAFISGAISLTVGPVTIEAVPGHMRATASGVVIAVGELFGGGVAPVVAGILASQFGISAIFYLAIGGLMVGLCASLLLRETLPARVRAA